MQECVTICHIDSHSLTISLTIVTSTSISSNHLCVLVRFVGHLKNLAKNKRDYEANIIAAYRMTMFGAVMRTRYPELMAKSGVQEGEENEGEGGGVGRGGGGGWQFRQEHTLGGGTERIWG